ncbi:PadR family transcriptional regulator [Paenibacillus sp. PastF-3]|uniref:PadR family transcriptional regulator n=1 Tax=Paenibacillus sp. PastF-3 TaxID=2940626 RepID=UPI00247603EF|nr:PadR family transcriptional regulator [Paenibacillus sp. PastF-3]
MLPVCNSTTKAISPKYLKNTRASPLDNSKPIRILTVIKKRQERAHSKGVRGDHGYKIVKDLSEHIENSESTLYPILKRLETQNCETVYSTEHNSRLRKYYKITPQGKDKTHDFLKEWETVLALHKFIKGDFSNVEMDKDLNIETKNDHALLSGVSVKGSIDATLSNGDLEVTKVAVGDTLKMKAKNGDITSKASKGKNRYRSYIC